MAHYTSKNMWDWKFEGFVKLSSDKTIDATFFRMPDGKWRAWYKDETRNAAIMTAESDDLFHWTLNLLTPGSISQGILAKGSSKNTFSELYSSNLRSQELLKYEGDIF